MNIIQTHSLTKIYGDNGIPVTALNDVNLEFEAGEMVPVDEFVEKPISPDTLIAKVEKLLQQKVEG